MPARMPALSVKGRAWLLPRALVHAGEARFERADAGSQPLKASQPFPMVGVQLLQDGSKLLRMRLSMKAIVYAQLHPAKTMKQFINDRSLYRILILGMLLVNWCF